MATNTTPRLALPYPDGTERVMDGDDAIGALALAVDEAGLPAAAATGTVTVPMAGAGAVNATVTLPVGTFTVAPVIMATVAAGSNVFYASVYLDNGAASFKLYVSHRDNTGTATNVLVGWLATQMSPGAAAGGTRRLLDDDELEVVDVELVTCETPGCVNRGRPVAVPVDLDAAYCGPCGAVLRDEDAGAVPLPGPGETT
jgi:hypothetical protein